MQNTSSLDSRVSNYLREKGFKQKGNVFLRIHGDGVLQCIYSETSSYYNTPVKSMTIPKPLSIAVRSIFEPNVFSDIKIYRGALTYPYSLVDFGIEQEQFGSPYKLLTDCCMPILEETNTQESFYKLLYMLDTTCYNEVRWYMEMLTIPSLIYVGKYANAKEACERVLSHNSNLSHVVRMYKLLLGADDNQIRNFLDQVRLSNLLVYQKLRFH